MCPAGDVAGDYLTTSDCSVRRTLRFYLSQQISNFSIFWVVSYRQRIEIKTIKRGKYAGLTCIRCPRALPEGLSGLTQPPQPHPQARSSSNRGYF